MTELPANWCATSVAAISHPLRYGYTASAAPEADGPKFLRITDIQNGRVVWQGVPRCKIDKDKLADYLLSSGDIVFARTGGTVGKSFLIREVPEPAVFASYLIKVSPAQGIEPQYLYWFFQSLNYWEQIALKKGGLQGNVNAKTLGSVELALPPTNEQRRIVEKIEAMFERIDEGVESLRAARATLGLYRQSLLKSAFEGRLTADWRAANPDKLEDPQTLLTRLETERDAWLEAEFQRWQDEVARWEVSGSKGPKPRKPETHKPGAALTAAELSVLPQIPDEWRFIRLSDLTSVGSGMSVSKARKLEDPVEIPYLRVANVQRGHLDLAEIKTMPVERSQLSGLALRNWDILFNEGGDRDKLGRGWIWDEQVEPCITQNHVFRATPYRHDRDWSRFISEWGNSYGRDYFEDGGKQTTNLASINKTVLKALPVPICSPAEQAEIVRLLDAKLSAADRLEAEIDAALTRADALRQSILKQAFSGRLVPQDPADEPAPTLLARIKADRAKAPTAKRRKASA